jgi:hypothetical protein
MFSGSTQSVAIASRTRDAEIYVDGGFVGRDSARIDLEKNKNHYVEIKRDGFKPVHRTITNDLKAGWLVLDIISFTGLAIIIDALTGDWYGLSPDNIGVELEAEHK